MKQTLIYLLVIALAIVGCNQNADTKVEAEANLETETSSRKIEVVEHMNGGGYTFIKGKEAGSELWIAVRQMPIEVGEVLYFTSAMEMANFESKSLNKTFDKILFVDNASKTPGGGDEAVSSPHGGMPGMMSSSDGHSKPKVEEASDIKVTPLADGMTVEKVNVERSSLAGKTVKVRGVVTKFNPNIMKVNWLHIQDGTGSGVTADLTVTTTQEVKVGETIVIEGTVAIDKDFGSGYFYEVIVEEAKVTVEQKI